MRNNNNRINVSQAKAAMNQFKMRPANEVSNNLQSGYNGHLLRPLFYSVFPINQFKQIVYQLQFNP